MTAICETSREQLVRMIEAAILAPSAENTQPWRFAIDGDRLLVGIDRSRTLASDVDDMLTLTGIGAAIENAVIAARGKGWSRLLSTAATATAMNTGMIARFGQTATASLKRLPKSPRRRPRPATPSTLTSQSGARRAA